LGLATSRRLPSLLRWSIAGFSLDPMVGAQHSERPSPFP
jgi:hypothetical protein